MMKLTHNPALQERPEAINARSVDSPAHVFMGAMVHGFMGIIGLQVLVAWSIIGSNQGNIIGNSTANEAIESRLAGILNDLGNDHALASDSADNCNLAGWTATVDLLAEMPVLIFAADIRFHLPRLRR